MPQSQANILVHIVFHQGAFPFLRDPSTRSRVHAYVAAVLNACDSPALEVGGPVDHIHAIASLSRNRAIADIIREAKSNSTGMAKTLGGMMSKFSWQGGYGVFSLHPSQLEIAKSYVRNQEEHHRVRTFEEEYLALLGEYGISYDPRYIWK